MEKLKFCPYYERINHGLILTSVTVSEEEIIIVDSEDYYDDDSEHDDCWIINSSEYQSIINRLQKSYIPLDVSNLDDQMLAEMNLLGNTVLKTIFLYILGIANYEKRKPEEEYRSCRGESLIKIICGDEITFKYSVYSKGA